VGKPTSETFAKPQLASHFSLFCCEVLLDTFSMLLCFLCFVIDYRHFFQFCHSCWLLAAKGKLEFFKQNSTIKLHFLINRGYCIQMKCGRRNTLTVIGSYRKKLFLHSLYTYYVLPLFFNQFHS
jgi:hypothetical protein